MTLRYSSDNKRNSSTSIICSSKYNNTIFWTSLSNPIFYFSQNTKHWTVSDRPRDSRPKLMFPAVTALFLFQAFALSQCSKNSRVLNLKTLYLIIAYLAPSLCSIPKVFAFLSQCWNTVGNGFTHVMWCHLILLKLNPTHGMYRKAEDLEKTASWNVKAHLFLHHRGAFTVVLKSKKKSTYSALWEYTYKQIDSWLTVGRQFFGGAVLHFFPVFYSKMVFQGAKC